MEHGQSYQISVREEMIDTGEAVTMIPSQCYYPVHLAFTSCNYRSISSSVYVAARRLYFTRRSLHVKQRGTGSDQR